MSTTSLYSLVQSWVKSDSEFSVDFDLLWSGLGYSRKDAALRKFEAAEFIDGQDFRVIHRNVENLQVGRPTNHYFLTVDAAKAFCMMANTDAGRTVRAYFIACEKRLKEVLAQNPVKSLSDREMMETAFKALGERLAQDRYCDDKPGLRNIIEQASKANRLSTAKASVEEIALIHFDVELSSGELNSLGRTCATTYRTWYNAEPQKELQEVNGRKTPVCVYGSEMYSTIENWLVNKGYIGS